MHNIFLLANLLIVFILIFVLLKAAMLFTNVIYGTCIIQLTLSYETVNS